MNLKECGHDLIWGTIPKFAWQNWRKSRKNLRIVGVQANFLTGHFLNTNHKRSLEKDNIKMDLRGNSLLWAGLNYPMPDFCEKNNELSGYIFMACWETVQSVLQNEVCMVTWALLSVFMFHIIFYSEDVFWDVAGCSLVDNYLNMEKVRSSKTLIPIKKL